MYDNFLNKGAEKYETKFTNCFFLFFIPSLYPELGWSEALTELLEEIEAIEQDDVKASLATFIKQALNKTNDQLIDSYVYTFDFGKKTNMYLTYMNTGEQRERGIELLELKQHYKKSGFEVTDKELPDYLPLLLEFLQMQMSKTVNQL